MTTLTAEQLEEIKNLLSMAQDETRSEPFRLFAKNQLLPKLPNLLNHIDALNKIIESK